MDKVEYTIGEKVHYAIGSDVYPATIVDISKNIIIVREDYYKADLSKHNKMGHQNWIIQDNLNGRKIKFTKRKDGSFRMVKGKSILRKDWRAYYCWEF